MIAIAKVYKDKGRPWFSAEIVSGLSDQIGKFFYLPEEPKQKVGSYVLIRYRIDNPWASVIPLKLIEERLP